MTAPTPTRIAADVAAPSLTRDLILCAAVGASSPLFLPLGAIPWAHPWLFPLISVAIFYPLFWRLCRRHAAGRATLATLLWVFAHSVGCIWSRQQSPELYEAAVWNAQSYRLEMFRWLVTGEGAEGDIRLFWSQHLLHFALFVLLCSWTRCLGGLLLGVLLLNYMNGYVGALTLEGNPWVLAVLGWHPWALLRVVGFLYCAVLILQRQQRTGDDGEKRRSIFDDRGGWGRVGALLMGDVLLKWLGAAGWRELIRSHMMG